MSSAVISFFRMTAPVGCGLNSATTSCVWLGSRTDNFLGASRTIPEKSPNVYVTEGRRRFESDVGDYEMASSPQSVRKQNRRGPKNGPT